MKTKMKNQKAKEEEEREKLFGSHHPGAQA